jgi:two-component system, LytTR family, sensor kinase
MKRSWLGWIAAAAFLSIFGIACALQIWTSMATHGHSIVRITVYQLVVWNAWLAIGVAVRSFARRVPLVPPTSRAVLLHILFALTVALVHVAWWSAAEVTIRPYDAMSVPYFGSAFIWIAFANLLTELLLYIGAAASAYAAEYYARYRERDLLAAQLETSLADARVHALELQLQPHFLFNTLNSVSALVRTNRNSEAVVMIAGLSDLLRYTLDHAGVQRVALQEEAAMLARYLAIEQTRFADRLRISVDIPSDTKRAAVPTLILQPLAENAVRHGLSKYAGPGRIELRAARENGMLRLEIFNSGTLDPAWRSGIGLSNTAERLERMYGPEHRFDITQSDDGVLVSLAFPWSELL